jgi:hypothetical protein
MRTLDLAAGNLAGTDTPAQLVAAETESDGRFIEWQP